MELTPPSHREAVSRARGKAAGPGQQGPHSGHKLDTSPQLQVECSPATEPFGVCISPQCNLCLCRLQHSGLQQAFHLRSATLGPGLAMPPAPWRGSRGAEVTGSLLKCMAAKPEAGLPGLKLSSSFPYVQRGHSDDVTHVSHLLLEPGDVLG